MRSGPVLLVQNFIACLDRDREKGNGIKEKEEQATGRGGYEIMKQARIVGVASSGWHAKSFAIFLEPASLIECDVFEPKEVYVHFDLSLEDCCPLYEISFMSASEWGDARIQGISMSEVCHHLLLYLLPVLHARIPRRIRRKRE